MREKMHKSTVNIIVNIFHSYLEVDGANDKTVAIPR